MDGIDREKVVECMFDPVTSLMLAELEDGPKKCAYLAQKASVPEPDVLERLSYMIECGLVCRNGDELAADHEKLGHIMDGANFGAAISGLEKMDSYLN